MPDSQSNTIDIFHAAVRAADPHAVVLRHTDELRSLYLDGGFTRLIAVGIGKASFSMALAVEEALGDLLETGIIITKYGHASKELQLFRVFEAGHPIPDRNGQHGTEEIIKLVENADENTLVITLISGGGSALLVSPCEDVLLEEKQAITSLLLRAGADIGEMNTVRKHLSRVKGGRLAEIIFPAAIVSLILSDVIGDRLDVIASGPTVPDPTTYAEALGVLEKYKLLETVPSTITRLLEMGAQGMVAETPKPDDPVFRNVKNSVIGSNRTALEEAQREAERCGLKAEIIGNDISGEAQEAGRWLAGKAIAARLHKGEQPLCLLSGGETTVVVSGPGTGGRNMELALAFALEIDGIPGITLLSAGTDGIDGPTGAAGAIVDGSTVMRARQQGLDPLKYLRTNDSYTFFSELGGLFITGPTGTNVMDVQIMVIE
jgi:glycerate 2-kinase